MPNYFLGSVGTAEAFRKNGDSYELAFVSNTLTDSAINISCTADDLRAGQGGAVKARFYHDTSVTITLTDIYFKEDYIRAQLGAEFESGNEAYYSESIVCTEANKLTLTYTPKALPVVCGDIKSKVIAWYKEEGADEYKEVTTDGAITKDITVVAEVNKTYCVRYLATEIASKIATVTSMLLPEELFLVIRTPLFAGDACAASRGKAAGEVQFEVPRFSLDGAQDFTLNMSSNTTMSLAGQALASDSGCVSNGSKMLRIIKIETGAMDNPITAIYSSKGQVALAVNETQTLDIYAVHQNNYAEELDVTSPKLTYATSAEGKVTVDKGTIKGIAAGNATITITYTDGSLVDKDTVEVTVALYG